MQSLIKSSNKIKSSIVDRMKEHKITQANIIKDAKEVGIIIYKPNLSNYLSNKTRYNLTQDQILFICTRYGINVTLKTESVPYNEKECIKKVKLIFGK